MLGNCDGFVNSLFLGEFNFFRIILSLKSIQGKILIKDKFSTLN